MKPNPKNQTPKPKQMDDIYTGDVTLTETRAICTKRFGKCVILVRRHRMPAKDYCPLYRRNFGHCLFEQKPNEWHVAKMHRYIKVDHNILARTVRRRRTNSTTKSEE